jgi:hypothetical protein
LKILKNYNAFALAAYTDYLFDEIPAHNNIHLKAARKSNSRKPHNLYREYLISIHRKRIETAFSDIAKYMPEKIHAVTQNGGLIKLLCSSGRIFLINCITINSNLN